MFEVGKKVICVISAKNSEGRGVYKGNIYTLNAIIKGCCGDDLYFDVGIKCVKGQGSECPTCRTLYRGTALLVTSKAFAPYDDSLSETTVEELLYQLTA